MKNTQVRALPLFGKLMVVVADRGRKSQGDYEREPMTEEQLRKLKTANKQDRMERKDRQREAEKTQIDTNLETMSNIAKRNNAGLRHITTFVNMVEYAQKNNKSIAMGELKKKMTEEDAIKEWSTVRGWLGKNAPALCAVSIGKRPKGWWFLRWVTIGDHSEEDIFTMAAPLHLYLVKKRKWQTKATAMETEAERLKDHYLTRYEDDEETFGSYVPEMFEVYRSQLAMPKTSRTYRTEGVKEVLEMQAIPVSSNASFVVNGENPKQSSRSGMALCEAEVKRGIVKETHWVCAEDDERDPFDSWCQSEQLHQVDQDGEF